MSYPCEYCDQDVSQAPCTCFLNDQVKEIMNERIPPEVLITQLNDENAKLKLELAKTIDDLKDFETLAIGWKDGYSKEVRDLKIKNKHLEQTIEELQSEVNALQKSIKQYDLYHKEG